MENIIRKISYYYDYFPKITVFDLLIYHIAGKMRLIKAGFQGNQFSWLVLMLWVKAFLTSIKGLILRPLSFAYERS